MIICHKIVPINNTLWSKTLRKVITIKHGTKQLLTMNKFSYQKNISFRGSSYSYGIPSYYNNKN